MYRLFKEKLNEKKVQGLVLEVTSRNLKAFNIWDLFKLNNVDIKYLNGDWQVRIDVEVFTHKIKIIYENG